MQEALAANKHLLQRLLTRQQNQTSENKAIVTDVGELKHAQMKMQSEMASSFADLHAAIASRKTDTEAGLLQVLGHSVRVRTQEVQGYQLQGPEHHVDLSVY